MNPLPSGTITFAFTDIEASSTRWERDRAAMQAAVRRHDALVRAAIVQNTGSVFKTIGDAFCAAFSRPGDAVAAMLEVQRSLLGEDFSALGGLFVRAAIHTGTADERDGDYFGPAVNRVARLLAIGHGGQVLVSGATAAVLQGDLPELASLRDLGEHRLKDLERAERVYQLEAPDLPAAFPPLRSLNSLATNLPVQLTSFLGREREIAEIAELVRERRLVTLVGSGGVGKTRAALQVAANLLDAFIDGVWLIELEALSSGDFIASTVAHVLGIGLAGSADPTESLIQGLRQKSALLVFDNCEHLAAPAARAIGAILSACPDVKVLASSRQPLAIDGEETYVLPPLEIPAAAALFAQRARAADKRFALTGENAATVAEICRRLDGVPLAIELAAPKITLLSLSQLLEMLHERFRLLAQPGVDRLPRQQTLRALIDWSYDLLDDDERAAFARLSVFSGGWTLKAAAAVCTGGGIDEWRVFELLEALVSKSLVVTDSGDDERRFHMLNSIHEYSRQKLTASGETEAVAARHVSYYRDLVRDLAPLLESLEDVQWQRALSPEIDNLRAAVDWAIFGRHDVAAGLQLLAQVEWAELLTTPQEAIRWFDAAVALLDEPVDAVTKARVARHHVRLGWLVGRQIAQLEAFAVEALAVARAAGDPSEVAQALANLAGVHRDAGRFERAEALYAEAYAEADALSRVATNAVLRNWAVSNLQRGDTEMARQRFSEVARRERPGSEAHASALINIGELEFAVGNVEAARAAARAARETLVHLRAAPLALVVCNLAAYAMAVDELDEARDLLREALDLLRESGARWMTTALEHHAMLAGLIGDHERAAILVGFTNARYAGNDTRQTTEQYGYERLMGLLTRAYDETELARQMSAGASLNAEQALEQAAAITQHHDRRRRPPSQRSTNHGQRDARTGSRKT